MLDVRTSGNCVCVMDCVACPVSGDGVITSLLWPSGWHFQAGEGVSWASWSWQWPGSSDREKLPGEWHRDVPDLYDHLDSPGSCRVHVRWRIPLGRGGKGNIVPDYHHPHDHQGHLITQVVCQTSGQWSGAMPQCVRAQGEVIRRRPNICLYLILTNA